MDFRQKLEHLVDTRRDFILQSETSFSYSPDTIWSDEKEKLNSSVLPPLESFMDVPEEIKKEHFFKTCKPSDIGVCTVTGVKDTGLMLTLLCLDQGKIRDIENVKISGFCPVKEVPQYFSHKNPLEAFAIKDKVRVIICDVTRIIFSMSPKRLPENLVNLKLGLISDDDLPLHYQKLLNLKDRTYDECLQTSTNFGRPSSTEFLTMKLGIKLTTDYSLLKAVRKIEIPPSQMAAKLRSAQLLRYSTKQVAKGVKYFKDDMIPEAMQCFNFALTIDDKNADAYVARGAVYASSGSFLKAIEDLEKAIALDPDHTNANNYLAQTFLAHGKRLAESGDLVEGEVYIQRATNLVPSMREADEALRMLRKTKAKKQQSEWEAEHKTLRCRQSLSPLSPPRKPSRSPPGKFDATKEKLERLIKSDVKREKYYDDSKRDVHVSSKSSDQASSRHNDLKNIVIVRQSESTSEHRSVVYRERSDASGGRRDKSRSRYRSRHNSSGSEGRSRRKRSRSSSRESRSDNKDKPKKDETFPWSRWNGYSSTDSESNEEKKLAKKNIKLWKPLTTPQSGSKPEPVAPSPAKVSRFGPEVPQALFPSGKDGGAPPEDDVLSRVQERIKMIEKRYQNQAKEESDNVVSSNRGKAVIREMETLYSASHLGKDEPFKRERGMPSSDRGRNIFTRGRGFHRGNMSSSNRGRNKPAYRGRFNVTDSTSNEPDGFTAAGISNQKNMPLPYMPGFGGFRGRGAMTDDRGRNFRNSYVVKATYKAPRFASPSDRDKDRHASRDRERYASRDRDRHTSRDKDRHVSRDRGYRSHRDMVRSSPRPREKRRFSSNSLSPPKERKEDISQLSPKDNNTNGKSAAAAVESPEKARPKIENETLANLEKFVQELKKKRETQPTTTTTKS